MQMVTTNNLRSDENTLLHGRWLIIARIAWIACVVLTLVIFFASIPVYITQLETICSGAGCAYRQLSPEQAAALQAGGFSLVSYAAYNVVLDIISVVFFFAVSFVIFWRCHAYHDSGVAHPTLRRVRYLTLSLMGYRCHH
jgi:hypothetical protein